MVGTAQQLEGIGPWWQKELAKGASQVRPIRKRRVQAGSKAGGPATHFL